MSLFINTGTFVKAAAVAITLGLGALCAPAMANDLRFGIMFGDERSDFRFGSDYVMCKTQYQIRQAFSQRGYQDVFLNVLDEPRVQVRATRGNTVYLIDYDYCRDRIIEETPLRAAR